MKRLSGRLIIFMIFILIGSNGIFAQDDGQGFSERGITKKKRPKTKSNKKKKKAMEKIDRQAYFKLNNKDTFKNVKKQKVFTFLIGNDNYQKESDFGKLAQCYNDVKLLKSIFIECLHADSGHVMDNKDLSIAEFRKRFQAFVELVKTDPKALVIITYSGHGDMDGSLVFVKGGKLMPDELKALVNSFSNDTVLLIDACYSGNNEGPKEILKGVKKQEFKSNSIRVYASLAHLTAKEIKYNNTFFSHLKKFYKDTLKIDNISGNGYFTGMIGMFFAEYKFKKDENISFKDLLSYITNRSKQYVEYLAMWGKEDKLQAKMSQVRLNQQPKMLPVKERVDFQDINHNFLLVQKLIKPIGFQPGLSGGVFLPFGDLGGYYQTPGLYANLSIAYELDFILKDFYAVINFSFISLNSIETGNLRPIDLSVLIPAAGVKYKPLKLGFFEISTTLDAGMALSFLNIGSYGPIKEESLTKSSLYFSFTAGLHFEVIKDLHINLQERFSYIGYQDKPLYGLSSDLGMSYYF
ncbi:MAG: caspase family protein [Spirochaetota bacterium]|nr:caspase family protein [Spirochaetota bacterium]